ncbi:MAG TPA: cyclic nucleotide-binding domain-containing protein [bacterium]|nr:cyclic nucleotide-binding domain-containing protein [bacterium]
MLKAIDIDLQEKLPTFDELLGDLSTQELKDFSVISEEVKLAAGTVVFSEGTTGDYLYIIADGQIGIYQTNAQTGRQVEIARLGKGNILGDMAFLVEKFHSATCKAIVDSVCYRISRRSFQEMEKENLRLCYKLILAITKVLSYRLKKRNQQLSAKIG